MGERHWSVELALSREIIRLREHQGKVAWVGVSSLPVMFLLFGYLD